MTEREEILEQANALGLDFPSNVKTEKLKAMIAESQGPAMKPEEKEEDTQADPKAMQAQAAVRRMSPLRQRIQDAKKRALKTHIVTITNKDNRENDVMTTVSLSFENMHFGLSREVPLDVPVEIEQSLIDIAEGTMMTLHKDEIVSGKRTGNKVPVTVKKFAISYSRQEPDGA